MTDDNKAIIEINRGRMALEAANDIHEILDLRDKAAAWVIFTNAQGFKEAAQEAKIFQLNAERKAGKWIEENVRHEGGRPVKLLQDETVLPDGIDRNESHRWQLQAIVPEEKYTEWVDECLATNKEITAAGLQRIGRLVKFGEKESPQLPQDKYRVIYADPPWKYDDKLIEGYGSAEHHYPAMTIQQICELGIKDIAADNAVLFLWVTSPMLREAFTVIDAWGFEYKASFVWDKIKHNYGHYNSIRHEFLFICTRGSCVPDTPVLYDSVQSIERMGHSEKPELFRQIIDELYPTGKRIELFARKYVEGWEVWGNEIG